MVAESSEKRQELVEAISNVDDQLGEMFLEEKTPTNEQLMVCLFHVQCKYLFLSYFYF